MNNDVMYSPAFMDALFILFPDITTNKQLLNKQGNISVIKLAKFCGFAVDDDDTTYREFYEYLYDNQHMYDWWML